MFIKYRYTNIHDRFLKRLLVLIDYIGYFLFSRKYKQTNIKELKDILIVQHGNIGDCIIMLPFIQSLKKQLPTTNIKVACGSYVSIFLKQFKYIDELIEIDCKRFTRKRERNILTLIAKLKKLHADLIFEKRGDWRILLALKLFAKTKNLVGFNAGGFGFVLDQTLPYIFKGHEHELYCSFLKEMFLETNCLKYWHFSDFPTKRYNKLELQNYICIHVGTAEQAKKWEEKKFISLIKRLSEKNTLIILGLKTDLSENNIKKLHNNKNIHILLGETTVLEGFDMVKNSKLFIGLDSGFTHAAALMGKNIVALFSAVNDCERWKPIELIPNSIKIIKTEPKCSYNGKGCDKINCENNICMKSISVEEVELLCSSFL